MAGETKIGVIVGSLRKGSYSRRIARALMARSPAQFSAELIEIGDLPHYNEDLDEKPPAQWTVFRDAVRACNALLFVTPEYNRSVPGVLKNATDIGSRPEGNNVFDGLPAAVVSTSPYLTGGMAANHALRQPFVFLNLAVMQQPEAYLRNADKLVDADGNVADNACDTRLRAFMDAFGRWIMRFEDGSPTESFDAFLVWREAASNAYISGDAEPLAALSARHDPVTFFPPSGETVVGSDAVIAANRAGAKSFANGGTGRFEVLASAAGPDFGYWTGIQHANAHLRGEEASVPMKLRTTEIFRNDRGNWKLVHRHADMLDCSG